MAGLISAIGAALGLYVALMYPSGSKLRALFFALATFAGVSAIAGTINDAQDAIIAQLRLMH